MSSGSVLRQRQRSDRTTNSHGISDHTPLRMGRRTLINLMIVFFSVFLDTMGMSIVQPILPFYAEKFDASSLQLGLLYSSYAMMSAFATLVMGPISDKYGRRKVIIFSLFGTMIGFLMHGFAQSYYELLGYRFLTGAFGGTFPIAQAYVTDVVPAAQRPTYMAAAGGTLSIAFIVGPGMGSGLAEFGLRVPFFASAGLGLFGLVFAFFALEESHPKFAKNKRSKRTKHFSTAESKVLKEKSTSPGDTNIAGNAPLKINVVDVEMQEEEEKEKETEAKTKPKSPVPIAVWIICIVYFFASIAWSAYTSMYALYIIEVFHLTSLETGFITLCMATFFVCGTIIIFNLISKKVGIYFACMVGQVIFTIALAVSTLPENVWPHLAIVVLGFGTGFGIIMPAMSSMAADFTNEKNRGKILGFVSVSSNLAMVAGPLMHGALFDIDVQYPFFVAAGFVVLSMVILAVLIAKYPVVTGLAAMLNRKKAGVPPDWSNERMVDEDLDVCDIETYMERLKIAEAWKYKADDVTEEDYLRLGHTFGEILSSGNYKWIKYFDGIMDTLRKLFPALSIDDYMLYMEDIDEIIKHAEVMAGDKKELDRIRAMGEINF